MRPLLAARSAAALALREPQQRQTPPHSPVGPSCEEEWVAWAKQALGKADAGPPAAGAASPLGALGGAAVKGLVPVSLAGLDSELQSTKLSCSQQLMGLRNVASQLRLQADGLSSPQSPCAGLGGATRAQRRALPRDARRRATSPLCQAALAAGGATEAAAAGAGPLPPRALAPAASATEAPASPLPPPADWALGVSPAAGFARASSGTVAVAAAGAPASPAADRPTATLGGLGLSPGRLEAPRRPPQPLEPVAEAEAQGPPGAVAEGRGGAREPRGRPQPLLETVAEAPGPSGAAAEGRGGGARELIEGQWSGEEKERHVRGLVGHYLPGEDGLVRLFVDVFSGTPLPAPWLPCRDGQDRIVFLNSQTGDAAWNSPLDGVMKEIAMICRAFLQLPLAQRDLCISSLQEQWDSEITQELGQWTQAQDRMSGQGYYYHQATKDTMWQPPSEVFLPAHYFRMRLTEMFRHQGPSEAAASPASPLSAATAPDRGAARSAADTPRAEDAAADGAGDGGARSARLQAQRSLLRRGSSVSSPGR